MIKTQGIIVAYDDSCRVLINYICYCEDYKSHLIPLELSYLIDWKIEEIHNKFNIIKEKINDYYTRISFNHTAKGLNFLFFFIDDTKQWFK